jgi:hypothetical protein
VSVNPTDLVLEWEKQIRRRWRLKPVEKAAPAPVAAAPTPARGSQCRQSSVVATARPPRRLRGGNGRRHPPAAGDASPGTVSGGYRKVVTNRLSARPAAGSLSNEWRKASMNKMRLDPDAVGPGGLCGGGQQQKPLLTPRRSAHASQKRSTRALHVAVQGRGG